MTPLGSVTVRTRFTPAVTMTPGVGGGASSGQGVLSEIMGRVLMPEVDAGLVSYAPFGRPGDQWIAWTGALVVLTGLGLRWVLRRKGR